MINRCLAGKIVIVSSVPLSEPVVRNRTTPFFRNFLDAGYEVFFVCPRSEENASKLEEGVRLYEVPIDFNKPRGFIRRAGREAYDVLQLLKYAKKIEADAWLLTIPSMFLAFLAPFSLRQRKVFLDVRDLTWEYLSDDKLLHRFSKNIFRLLFKRSLNFFKLVTATNSTEIVYLKKIWRGEQAPLLVTNGITREQFDKLADLKTQKNDTITVSYVGNIGLAQELDTLVEAAVQLPEVDFRVIGVGIDFDRISELVAEINIENIVLTGRVDWEDVRKYYGSTDVLYAQLTPEYSGAMPSKLYEYLATGKYIIYGGQGQAVETLSAFDNNQVVPPRDVSALVAAIKAYKRARGSIKTSKGNRDKIRREYIREDAAKKLVKGVGVELT